MSSRRSSTQIDNISTKSQQPQPSRMVRPTVTADFSDDEAETTSYNAIHDSVVSGENNLSPRSNEKQQRALHYAGITRALQDTPRAGTSVTKNVDAEEIKKVEEHLAHMRKLRKDNEDRMKRQKGSSEQRLQELQAFLQKSNEDEERVVAQIEQLKQEQQARRDNKRREMAEARARNREKLEFVSNTSPRTSKPIYKRKEEEWRNKCITEEMERAEILANKRNEKIEHKFDPRAIQLHRSKHDAIVRERANVHSLRLDAVRSPPKHRVAPTRTLQQAKQEHALATRGREHDVEMTREKVLRGREYAAGVRVPAIDRSKASEVMKRKKGENELQIERRRQEGLANRLKLLKDRNIASKLVKQGNDELRQMSPEKYRSTELPAPAPAVPRKYPDYLTPMRRRDEDLMASTDDASHSVSPRKRTKQSVAQELSLRIERQEARVERAEHALKAVIHARELETGRVSGSTTKADDELDARVRAGVLVDELRFELIELKFKQLSNEKQQGAFGIDTGISSPLNSPRLMTKAQHDNNTNTADVEPKTEEQEVDAASHDMATAEASDEAGIANVDVDVGAAVAGDVAIDAQSEAGDNASAEDAHREAVVEADIAAEVEAEVETEVEPEPVIVADEAETEVKTKAETEAETEIETETKTETKVEARIEAEAEMVADVQATAVVEVEAGAEIPVQADTQAEAEIPEAEATVTKAELETDELDAKSDVPVEPEQTAESEPRIAEPQSDTEAIVEAVKEDSATFLADDIQDDPEVVKPVIESDANAEADATLPVPESTETHDADDTVDEVLKGHEPHAVLEDVIEDIDEELVLDE